MNLSLTIPLIAKVSSGHLCRASHRTSNIRLYIPRPRLALDLLDRSHLRRRNLAGPTLPPRDLRTRAPRPPRSQTPQINQRPPYICAHRTREERFQANGNRHTHPSPPHALLRAYRPRNLHLPVRRIRNILHVFRSIPHYLPGYLQTISRCVRSHVLAYRSWDCCRHRSIPLLRQHIAKGTGKQQILDPERRISPSPTRLPRWPSVCDCALLARLDSPRIHPFLGADAGWHTIRYGFHSHFHGAAQLLD